MQEEKSEVVVTQNQPVDVAKIATNQLRKSEEVEKTEKTEKIEKVEKEPKEKSAVSEAAEERNAASEAVSEDSGVEVPPSHQWGEQEEEDEVDG